MAKLSAENAKLFPLANAALDELRRKWREMGVPPEGQAGILLAEFVNVSMTERGMSTAEVVQDIIDCFESQIAPTPRGQA